MDVLSYTSQPKPRLHPSTIAGGLLLDCDLDAERLPFFVRSQSWRGPNDGQHMTALRDAFCSLQLSLPVALVVLEVSEGALRELPEARPSRKVPNRQTRQRSIACGDF